MGDLSDRLHVPDMNIPPSDLLEDFFVTPRPFYFDDEFSQLSGILRANHLIEWSKNPRLYLILRECGRLNLFTHFISKQAGDDSLPLSERKLHKLLQGAAIKEAQLETTRHAISRHQAKAIKHDQLVYQRALDEYFEDLDSQTTPLDESDFEEIARLLKFCGIEQGLASPKLYYLLRSIGHEELFSSFRNHGYSDVWIPFRRHDIRADIFSRDSSVDRLLEAQRRVCSNGGWSEKVHLNFIDEPKGLKSLKYLGEGGAGKVDHVYCRSHRRHYARKSFPRSTGPLHVFSNEIKILKSISHEHCVAFAASYTDISTIAVLSVPVADMDLSTMMEATPLSEDRESFLQASFGCLAVAVAYLHNRNIVHKDIKPQNILIHSNRLLITDFGLSADTTASASTTRGYSPKYIAPEVANYEKQSPSSDVWSLGCVFLEILAILIRLSYYDITEYFKTHGSKRIFYNSNRESIDTFINERLNASSTVSLGSLSRAAKSVVREMLSESASARPAASKIVSHLSKGYLSSSKYGGCCQKELMPSVQQTYESLESHEPQVTSVLSSYPTETSDDQNKISKSGLGPLSSKQNESSTISDEKMNPMLQMHKPAQSPLPLIEIDERDQNTRDMPPFGDSKRSSGKVHSYPLLSFVTVHKQTEYELRFLSEVGDVYGIMNAKQYYNANHSKTRIKWSKEITNAGITLPIFIWNSYVQDREYDSGLPIYPSQARLYLEELDMVESKWNDMLLRWSPQVRTGYNSVGAANAARQTKSNQEPTFKTLLVEASTTARRIRDPADSPQPTWQPANSQSPTMEPAGDPSQKWKPANSPSSKEMPLGEESQLPPSLQPLQFQPHSTPDDPENGVKSPRNVYEAFTSEFVNPKSPLQEISSRVYSLKKTVMKSGTNNLLPQKVEEAILDNKFPLDSDTLTEQAHMQQKEKEWQADHGPENYDGSILPSASRPLRLPGTAETPPRDGDPPGLNRSPPFLSGRNLKIPSYDSFRVRFVEFHVVSGASKHFGSDFFLKLLAFRWTSNKDRLLELNDHSAVFVRGGKAMLRFPMTKASIAILRDDLRMYHERSEVSSIELCRKGILFTSQITQFRFGRTRNFIRVGEKKILVQGRDDNIKMCIELELA